MSRRYPKSFVFRVTEAEHEQMTAAAARVGVPVSEWIRAACAKILEFEKPIQPAAR